MQVLSKYCDDKVILRYLNISLISFVQLLHVIPPSTMLSQRKIYSGRMANEVYRKKKKSRAPSEFMKLNNAETSKRNIRKKR